MESLNQTGIRTMVLLGGLLVLAAVAVGSFRSAALLAGTMGIGRRARRGVEDEPAASVARAGRRHAARHELAERSRRVAGVDRAGRGAVVVGGRPAASVDRRGAPRAVRRPRRLQPRVPRDPRAVGGARGLARRDDRGRDGARGRPAGGAAPQPAAGRRGAGPSSSPASSRSRSPWCRCTRCTGFHDRGPRNFPPGAFGIGFRDFDGPTTQPTQLAALDPASVLGPLPRYSETLLGGHVQPVGLVVVADADHVRAALDAGGWTDADVVDAQGPRAHVLERGAGRHRPRRAARARRSTTPRAPDLVVHRPVGGGGEAQHEAEIWELPVVTAERLLGLGGHDLALRPDGVGLAPAVSRTPRTPRTSTPSGTRWPRSLAAGGRLADAGRFAFSRPGRRLGSRRARTTPTARWCCCASPAAPGRQLN